MERDGHLGITLLLSTPIVYALSETVSRNVIGLGVAGVVFWSLVPDVDQALPIQHRGPTHSVVAAGFAGAITAFLAVLLTTTGTLELSGVFVETEPLSSRAAPVVFGFGIGVLGVVSHLLGDVITPMGIRPWWPGSDRRYSLALVLSADIRANLALAYTGSLVLIATIALTPTA